MALQPVHALHQGEIVALCPQCRAVFQTLAEFVAHLETSGNQPD